MQELRQLETVIALLAAVLALATAARRVLIPYPIFLVLGGLVIGVVPRVPVVRLDPDLVFLIFLPPVLWSAAYFTSLRDFRANLRPITLLAVGLVLATTAVVAAVARFVMPGLSWPAAIALGAIVSPPDAVAASAIARRLGIPYRIVTVLEGESLINDAAALVLYRSAVAAVVTGAFSLGDALWQFVLTSAGGVLIGLVVAAIVCWALRLTEDSLTETAITLLAPYAAWILAERTHTSGVLACVAGGLYLRQYFSAAVAPATRMQANAVWRLLIFVLNGVIFALIGLQLGAIREAGLSADLRTLVRLGALISLAAIVIRLIWVPLAVVIPRYVSRALRERDPIPPWPQVLLLSWIGMRGIVSLAAALALPVTTASGAPFPFRDEIILRHVRGDPRDARPAGAQPDPADPPRSSSEKTARSSSKRRERERTRRGPRSSGWTSWPARRGSGARTWTACGPSTRSASGSRHRSSSAPTRRPRGRRPRFAGSATRRSPPSAAR